MIAAGLADTKEPIPYARGALVLWAPKGSPFQPLTGNTLNDPRIQKLAIANPDHAPYGRAAQAAKASARRRMRRHLCGKSGASMRDLLRTGRQRSGAAVVRPCLPRDDEP